MSLIFLLFPRWAVGQYSDILVGDLQAIKYSDGKLSIENLPGNFQPSNSTALTNIHGKLTVYFDGTNLRDNGGQKILGDTILGNFISQPKFLPFSPSKIGFLCTTNETLSSQTNCTKKVTNQFRYRIIEFQNTRWEVTQDKIIQDSAITNWSNYSVARYNDSVFQLCVIDPNKPDVLSNFLVNQHGLNFKSSVRLPIGQFFLDTIRFHPRIQISFASTITISHTGDRCVVTIQGQGEFCPKYNSDPVATAQKTSEIYSIGINRLNGKLGIPMLISGKSKLFNESDFAEVFEPFVFASSGKLIYRISNQIDNFNNRIGRIEQIHVTTKQVNGVFTQFKFPDLGYNAIRLLPNGRFLVQRDRRIKGKPFCYFDIIDNPNNANTMSYRALVDSLSTVCFLSSSIPNLYHYVRIKPQIQYKCDAAEIAFNNLSDTSAGLIFYNIKVQKSLSDTSILFSSSDINSRLSLSYNGRYPFVVKGWSASGYTEIWYDTLEISIPRVDSFNQNDKPFIKRVTLLNNQRILLEWKSFERTFDYEIYKNNQFLKSTKDSFYLEDLTTEVSGPIEYKIKCVDSCGNYTNFSNVGKTIFLKVVEQAQVSVNEFPTALLTWTPYEDWSLSGGVQNYVCVGNLDKETTNWQLLTNQVDTQFNDKQFIERSKFEKCYRIQARSADGRFVTESNTVCLGYTATLFAPNAFTPNGDGLNDEFEIFNYGFDHFTLTIFNSWGQKIYDSSSSEAIWKPASDVPTGVYVYQVKAYKQDKEYGFSSTVTLLR